MTRVIEDLVVHLGWLLQRMGPRDGREIFVAQFQLEGARKESALAQPPSHHFAKPHQSGLQALGVARIFVESVFVADRFRTDASSHCVVEPSAGVLAPRLPCERQSPLSKAIFEIAVAEAREV